MAFFEEAPQPAARVGGGCYGSAVGLVQRFVQTFVLIIFPWTHHGLCKVFYGRVWKAGYDHLGGSVFVYFSSSQKLAC